MRLHVQRDGDAFKAWLIYDRRGGPVALEVGEPMERPYPEGGQLPEQAAIELTHVSGDAFRTQRLELLKLARAVPAPPLDEPIEIDDPLPVPEFDWITRDELTGSVYRLHAPADHHPAVEAVVPRFVYLELIP